MNLALCLYVWYVETCSGEDWLSTTKVHANFVLSYLALFGFSGRHFVKNMYFVNFNID